MSEKDDRPASAWTKGRLFLVTTPSPDDLVRAASIPADQCPRRYCWWWQSLGFDWEVAPSEGCTFLTAPKPPDMANATVPCCRCDPPSTVDQYEPREPHLLEDGFAVPRWHSNHRRPNGEISYDLAMSDDMGFAEGSYPNYIPLPASAVERIINAVEPFEYDRVYGAFWDMMIERDGKAAVKRSATRYLRAIGVKA